MQNFDQGLRFLHNPPGVQKTKTPLKITWKRLEIKTAFNDF